jgi:hypothetical protein
VDVPQGRSALSCSRSIGDGDASSVQAARDAPAEVSEGDASGVSRRRKLDEVLPKCVHPSSRRGFALVGGPGRRRVGVVGATRCALAGIRFTVTLDDRMLLNPVARHPKTPVPGG